MALGIDLERGDRAALGQPAGDVQGRDADRGADLQRPARTAGESQHLQQTPGRRHDDGNPIPSGMGLHLSQHPVGRSAHPVDVVAHGGGHDHVAGR